MLEIRFNRVTLRTSWREVKRFARPACYIKYSVVVIFEPNFISLSRTKLRFGLCRAERMISGPIPLKIFILFSLLDLAPSNTSWMLRCLNILAPAYLFYWSLAFWTHDSFTFCPLGGGGESGHAGSGGASSTHSGNTDPGEAESSTPSTPQPPHHL